MELHPVPLRQTGESSVIRLISMERQFVAAVGVLLATAPSFVEDWGCYSTIPVSAPKLVLEAVNSGTTEGRVVSIGQPTAEANQKSQKQREK